jgi:hypothetical protein
MQEAPWQVECGPTAQRDSSRKKQEMAQRSSHRPE